MIYLIFVLSAVWYYSFREMQAAKRCEKISRVNTLESAWRMKLMTARVLLVVPPVEPALYIPQPSLFPSYVQQRPAREGDVTSLDTFVNQVMDSAPIEAIGNAHGMFKSSNETAEAFRLRVIERLNIEVKLEKGRR